MLDIALNQFFMFKAHVYYDLLLFTRPIYTITIPFECKFYRTEFANQHFFGAKSQPK